MNKVFSVCWDITSKCNEECEFCFRDAVSKDLSVFQNQIILSKLVKYGVKKITFTGGEASLYKELWELIAEAKTLGVKVHLVTNAKYLNEEFYENVSKYVDCITFPLDAANNITQERMTRNSNHISNVISALLKITEYNPRIRIKINTVVSCINYNEIENIFPIIAKYRAVEVWKLFKFTPLRHNSITNREKFEIGEDSFDCLENRVLEKYKQSNIKIVFQNSLSLCDSYFVISSNGNVLCGNENEQRIAGNMLVDEIDEIVEHIDFDYREHNSRERI